MDGGLKLIEDNPNTKANFLSRLCFTWMIKFFYKGARRGLNVIDLYKTLANDKSDTLGDRLEKNWNIEVEQANAKNARPSLIRAISRTFFWNYMFFGLLLFIQLVGLRAFQPVVLGYLISLFTTTAEKEEDLALKMYISGALLTVISIAVIFLNHHSSCGQALIGMRVRIAVSSLVYRKLLKLNKKSLGQTAAGQVVNLLSNDVSRFDFVSIALHYLWISPFFVIMVSYYLWEQVGIACLSGILSMILFTLPVQAYMGKLLSGVRTKIAARTDTRVRLMSEIVSGIQVIKMYAWEKPFEDMVKAIRSSEIKALSSAAYLRGIFLSCMVFIERTTLFLTVITYVLMNNVITPDKVFSMQQFFNCLQLALAIFLPLAISIGAETLVSIKRLTDFLVLEEKAESQVKISRCEGILLREINAVWTGEYEKLTMNNINLEIPSGKLCAIVGPVGAGKSSLLQLLLGELPPKTGDIFLNGRISYSSQEPWLFVSTVRNNILFGQQYDKQLYQKVTKVCALLPDFEQFPQKDHTMVGERGVSLSGGQRARINLARAVYRDADIYLMDDPLSAVDTHVGKHLFDECIVKYLKGKTRILVTHQLQYLKKADMIVVLNEGKIEAQGTFDELSNSDLDFTKMLVAADESVEEEVKEAPKEERRKSKIERALSVVSEMSTVSADRQGAQNDEEIGLQGKSAGKEYIKAAGNCCTIFTVSLIIIMGQVACSAADYWVSFWTDQEQIHHKNEGSQKKNVNILDPMFTTVVRLLHPPSEDDSYEENLNKTIYRVRRSKSWDEVFATPIDTDWAIYIYTVIIVLIIFLTLLRSFSFFKITLTASKNLHMQMFNSMLKAPMRFFDTNPSGRVLNRFSKDMGAVDEVLPRVTLEAIQIMLVMCGILVMVAISNYYMIIAMVIFGFLFLVLRKYYLKTIKILKHIEGITKSPVFSHLNSSLNGITTIRASRSEQTLIEQFDEHQDVHTASWFLTVYSTVSFGLWLDLICVLFTATITFSFIILNQYGSVSGSTVGLAISQSLILTGMLQYGMRQSAEVVNQMASVERVLHYTTLDEEGPFDTPKDRKISSQWPSTGHIKFNKMYLKYTPHDPPVLQDLNIDVQSGHKIGIVGRTGAGKSSLIAALFRLAPLEGSIIVDGVDTQQIGLNVLRKKISIIPQEPVLFSATLRYNLDPFGEYTDDQLWNALEEVELKSAVPTLNFIVDDGGGNFSLGERQLVCLARAILRNNKILVLDEATANVDPGTDKLIQTTIRRKFASCTVLTIAHRLNTIMDSDMVLVMDAGRMVEYDHPHTLLQNASGHFTSMVAQTGPSMTKLLRKVAKEAYYKTHSIDIDTEETTSTDSSDGDVVSVQSLEMVAAAASIATINEESDADEDNEVKMNIDNKKEDITKEESAPNNIEEGLILKHSDNSQDLQDRGSKDLNDSESNISQDLESHIQQYADSKTPQDNIKHDLERTIPKIVDGIQQDSESSTMNSEGSIPEDLESRKPHSDLIERVSESIHPKDLEGSISEDSPQNTLQYLESNAPKDVVDESSSSKLVESILKIDLVGGDDDHSRSKTFDDEQSADKQISPSKATDDEKNSSVQEDTSLPKKVEDEKSSSTLEDKQGLTKQIDDELTGYPHEDKQDDLSKYIEYESSSSEQEDQNQDIPTKTVDEEKSSSPYEDMKQGDTSKDVEDKKSVSPHQDRGGDGHFAKIDDKDSSSPHESHPMEDDIPKLVEESSSQQELTEDSAMKQEPSTEPQADKSDSTSKDQEQDSTSKKVELQTISSPEVGLFEKLEDTESNVRRGVREMIDRLEGASRNKEVASSKVTGKLKQRDSQREDSASAVSRSTKFEQEDKSSIDIKDDKQDPKAFSKHE